MAVLKMIPGDAEVAALEVKEELGEVLGLRNHFTREVQEAEELLAHITARVQKRKASLAGFEARLMELRIKAHMLGAL